MKRMVYRQLQAWKEKRGRKPLILRGARQVGKSYLLESFGKNEFRGVHIFNFEQNKRLHSIFRNDLIPDRIVTELSLIEGRAIRVDQDLVVFDEIQECPSAITSLKYFAEQMPELTICAAGSLLGLTLSSESFPVGKVEFMDLYPMNFEEFLLASENELLYEAFKNAAESGECSEIVHQKLWESLKEYYVTGGMPQVVDTYFSLRDAARSEALQEVRNLQHSLVDSYYKDVAKHSGKTNSMHIASVFENVPLQLAKNIDDSVKRYRFQGVLPGKRSYADLRGPIDWLVQAGLLHRVKICNRAEIPFESFCKPNLFKLYMFDIGLLSAMLNLPIERIIHQDFGITKGYLAENFVLQEFVAAGHHKLISWSERNSEIEFLRILDGEVVPIEVKSGLRTKAKSLQQFILKNSPSRAIKLSAKIPKKSDQTRIEYWPLYLAGQLK